jgi:predicted metal-dependent hydrolase
MSTIPLILGLVSDLFFVAPIENAVKALGYRLRVIERGAEIESADAPAIRQPGEPTVGRGAGFIARMVEWQPALVLVELNSGKIPWPEWIAALKSSPATRRIPVVAFGPHVDLELRARAENVGCDVILAKSALLRDLPGLIEKHARRTDHAALESDCQSPLSALALEGIALYNKRDFFEAHEVLEHAWNADPGPARELYRGLLQVAVAYLQIERGNYNGALKMFLRLRQWLDPLPDVCRGINVVQLRADALAAREALEALGPEHIAEFDRAYFKPVPMI